jgi:predicted nucleic acid-binding protein
MSGRHARELVERLMGDPRVAFLAEPDGLQPLWIAFSKRDDTSHLLWTDDYLAAFAQAADAELVTLDRSLRERYASVPVLRVRSSDLAACRTAGSPKVRCSSRPNSPVT